MLNRDIKSWEILSAKAESVGANIISFGTDDLIKYNFLSLDYHVAMNSLAVLACAKNLGVEEQIIFNQLEKFRALKGRGARKIISLPNGEATLIDESYNANPLSMHATLDSLAQSNAQGKKIAIIGDMLELGKDEKTFHADIKNLPCIKKIDTIHTIGTLMKNLHNVLPEDKKGGAFCRCHRLYRPRQ